MTGTGGAGGGAADADDALPICGFLLLGDTENRYLHLLSVMYELYTLL